MLRGLGFILDILKLNKKRAVWVKHEKLWFELN